MSNGEYPHRMIFGRTPDQIKEMIDKFEKGEQPNEKHVAWNDIEYKCNNCGYDVGIECYYLIDNYKFNYCPLCGTKVKWT